MSTTLLEDCKCLCEVFGEKSLEVPITEFKSNVFILTLERNDLKDHYAVFESVRLVQVKSDMKAQLVPHSEQWSALHAPDVPYLKGNHPLRELISFAYELVQGEMKLWGSILAASVDSLRVYSALCSSVADDLQGIIQPLLIDNKQSTTRPLKQVICEIADKRLGLTTSILLLLYFLNL